MLMVPDELFSNFWRVSYKRKQFAQIDEKVTEVRNINVGVPQGFLLGPSLFLINLNVITDTQDENPEIPLFADVCSILTSRQHNPFPAHEKQLHQISNWLSAIKLTLNFEMTFYLKFGRPELLRRNYKFPKTESSIKYFGIIIDSNLNFKNRISYVCNKKCELVGFLRLCK